MHSSPEFQFPTRYEVNLLIQRYSILLCQFSDSFLVNYESSDPGEMTRQQVQIGIHSSLLCVSWTKDNKNVVDDGIRSIALVAIDFRSDNSVHWDSESPEAATMQICSPTTVQFSKEESTLGSLKKPDLCSPVLLSCTGTHHWLRWMFCSSWCPTIDVGSAS